MDYYDFQWEKRFREAGHIGDFDFEKQKPSRKTPANIDQKPSGKPKVVPFSKNQTAIPQIETRTPRDFAPKIPFSKVINNPYLSILLQPSQTASPYEDEYDWRNYFWLA